MNISCILLTRFIKGGSDLDEWVQHHLSCGFSHIHIFNNGSEYDLASVCEKYGNKVSYESVDGRPCQYELYEIYIKECDADYVMPIDDDEYLWLAPEFKSIGDVLEHFGIPDCFGIRWKYMFPKRFNRVRNVPVLQYCTDENREATKFFYGNNIIKCIVKRHEFVRYMNADESMSRNHIPVTINDEGALLCNGKRVKTQIVRGSDDEPVRLLHCPYKGYDEFLHTRASSRPSISHKHISIIRSKLQFLKWLEARCTNNG